MQRGSLSAADCFVFGSVPEWRSGGEEGGGKEGGGDEGSSGTEGGNAGQMQHVSGLQFMLRL